MTARVDGDAQLRADAVGCGDEHGVTVAVHRQLEETAEATQAGHDAVPAGTPGQGLDALDEPAAAFDVDAGVAVGEGCLTPLGHRGMVRTATAVRKP